MKNRGGKVSGFSLVIGILSVLVIGHTLAHLHFYGLNGISGFSFANTDKTAEIAPQKSPFINFSMIFVIGEWLVLFVMIVSGRIIKKKNSTSEIKKIIAEKKEFSSSSKTDLDVLYDILKHQKKLGISEVASAFNVTKDVATEWAKMLEDSNLAEIEYSNIGEPVVRVK